MSINRKTHTMDEKFWQSAPKTYVDSASVAVMRGMGNTFLLALASGGNAQVFAFTPEHMKRFVQLIAHHVTEYEKLDGEIKTEPWAPGTKSPFSIEDIQGGNEPRKG